MKPKFLWIRWCKYDPWIYRGEHHDEDKLDKKISYLKSCGYTVRTTTDHYGRNFNTVVNKPDFKERGLERYLYCGSNYERRIRALT